MDRHDHLLKIYSQSKLSTLFEVKKEENNAGYSSIRLMPNIFRIYAFEQFSAKGSKPEFVRIYHGKIPSEIKEELTSIDGKIKSTSGAIDFCGDFLKIYRNFYEILSSDTSYDAAARNKTYTKNSAFEGLELPDIDVSDNEVLGVEFSWKEVVSINENSSDNNTLKKELSKPGIYLQRSRNGCARYVGSAYSDGGILARWMKHLGSNGDAKHLNLFVLENGYNDIVFTVLEFCKVEEALKREQRWKATLGSKNSGPYDGFRLNSN